MPGALNVFKTVTANLTTTTGNIYTPPIGYATVVLLAQISNIDVANTITITANVERTSGSYALIQNAQVPTADAISVLTGRLILNYGDQFAAGASANSSAQLTLSVLETLVG
jgi:hypothetical protein